MSNSIGSQVANYTNILDAIVTAEAKTADLNVNQELLGEFRGGGKIEIAKLSMDGLANYNKETGFVDGDVTLEWEEKSLAYDRSRQFQIDVMDDEERMGVVSMNLMAEFVRTKVIPEVDAVRFARLAGAAGTTVAKTFSGSTAVDDAIDAILAAEASVEDAGVVLPECILYCTASFKNLLRKGSEYRFGIGEGPDTNFETYDGMKVVTVPQARFCTAVTLNDGTTGGQTAGGYAKADSGADINFMVVHPDAAAAIARHETLRYWSPEQWQGANKNVWQYRLYHDLLTFANKASMVYLSKKA